MWRYFRNVVLLFILHRTDVIVCGSAVSSDQQVPARSQPHDSEQQNAYLHLQSQANNGRVVLQNAAAKSPSALKRASPSPSPKGRVPSPKKSPRQKSPKKPPSPKLPKSPKKPPSPKLPKSPKKPPSPKIPKSPKKPPSPKLPKSPKKSPSPKRLPSPAKAPSPRLPSSPTKPLTPGNLISDTERACWTKTPFYQGMNIAYNNYSQFNSDEPGLGWMYGSNFGDSTLYPNKPNYNRTFWADVFTDLQQAKGTVARFWLLGDGRMADLWKNGRNGEFTGFGPKFYQDLDDLFALAAARKIKLMPALFSWVIMEDKSQSLFPWPAEAPFDRSHLIKNWTIAEAFMEKMFKPLVIRYNKHPGLHSWDCINEPEQVTNPSPGTKGANFALGSIADWQHWVAMCTAVVHQNSVTPVTFGNWEVIYLCNNTAMGCQGNRWSDDNLRRYGLPHRKDLWKFTYLDFYQSHFYKKALYPLPDAQFPQGKPACLWGIDKPVLIGESPNRESNWGPQYAPSKLLEFACKNGYMGVMFWSMRTSQDEPTRSWVGFKPALSNFNVNTCTSTVVG